MSHRPSMPQTVGLAVLVLVLLACRPPAVQVAATPAPSATPRPTAIAPTAEPTPAYPDGNARIAMRGVPAVADPGPKPSWYRGLRYLGANYVQIVHFVEVDIDSGGISNDARTTESGVRAAISLARTQGLHVFLQLYPEYYSKSYWQKHGGIGPYIAHGGFTDSASGLSWVGELGQGPVHDEAAFLAAYTQTAISWARLAEELEVELYSPTCELNVFVSWQNNARWHQDVLPLLRQTYHGDLVTKGEINWAKYNLKPAGDLSFWDYYAGWDYVGGDVFGDDVSLASYPQYVNQLLSNLQTLKEKHRAKGIVLCEIGIPSTSAAWNNPSLTADEITLRYWDMLLQASVGKVDGVFFWAWDVPSLELHGDSLGPASPREWQGPGSLLRLYYTATSEEQRQAYQTLHQLQWAMSDLAGIGADTTSAKQSIDAGAAEYAAGRYAVANQTAGKGLALIKDVAPTLQAQALLVDTTETVSWLDSLSMGTLIARSDIDTALAGATQALKDGQASRAWELAQRAHRLAGTRFVDPEGDGNKEHGDIKAVWLQTDGLAVTAVIEVYNGAPTQAFAIDVDTNLDGNPDVGIRAWCATGHLFTIGPAGTEQPAEGNCGPRVLTVKAGLQLTQPVTAVEFRARIEREVAQNQWEFVDDLGEGLRRVESSSR